MGDTDEPTRTYVTEQWEDGAEGLVEVEQHADGRRRVRWVYLAPEREEAPPQVPPGRRASNG